MSDATVEGPIVGRLVGGLMQIRYVSFIFLVGLAIFFFSSAQAAAPVLAV